MHVALLFSATYVFAGPADDSAWTLISEKVLQNRQVATNDQWIKPSRYQRAILDLTRFSQQINATGQAEAGVIVSIPNPDGSLERFRVTPSGDMHQKLQLWFARVVS